MGGPATPPKPKAAPAPADETKAMLDAFAFAETERLLKKSSGRQSMFNSQTFSANGKTLLGA